MPRYLYAVGVDTDTGEAFAVELPEHYRRNLTVRHGKPRAVESQGVGQHADAARDALASIMPEPDDPEA